MSDRDAPLAPTPFDSASNDPGGSLKAATFEPLGAAPPPKPRPLTPRRLIAALVVSVAAGVLWFLFTARSIDIVVLTETTPDVSISGLAIPVGGRWLVRPGDYSISIEAEGYRPWTSTLTVSSDASQRFEVAPAILPGLVDIVSEPAGAQVSLDGEPLGVTPLRQRAIEAGDSLLELRLARYQPLSQTVSITGRAVSQTLAFELAPDWADVTVPTEPADAELRVDEVLVERESGQTIQILSGEHTITVSADGYQSQDVTLKVQAGVPQTLPPVTLAPAAGVLTLASEPTGANVTVNGEFRGRTPLALELPPERSHQVTVTRPGYFPVTTTATMDRGSTDRRVVKLRPRLGEVAFSISPADATLLIDGEAVGLGSQTLQLTAIEHRVEVRREGYAPYRGKLRPREGLAQVLDVALITEAEARRAAMQPEITTALGQTLVLIDPVAEPVNSFTLGAPRRDPGRRSNETLRAVKLERAFYIATTETTNAQFRQFLSSHDSGQLQGNSLNREHQPVVTISWQQAARFCNWLSDKEGLPRFYLEEQGIIKGFNAASTGYRLPSEAEWAYAAQIDGDSIRRYAWGEDFPPQKPVTNVADNTSAFVTGRILNGYADGHIVAAPVASYPANHRGLYDMGGNVAEWVHDVYSIPAPSSEEQVDPLGAPQGDNYTIRGASWTLSRLSELRLTYRDYGASGRNDLGFRIARYAE